jgi:very-short-patch-repair endonuclease
MHERDQALLRHAARQNGIIGRWQAETVGVTTLSLDARLQRGTLRRLHRGVYCIPALCNGRSQLTAAVLSIGPNAVASHRTAADLYGIVPDNTGMPEISVSRGHPLSRPDVLIHRVRLAADEVSECDGVPATTPARAVLDIAADLSGRQLEQVIAKTLRDDPATEAAILLLIARYPRRRGVPRLRSILMKPDPPAFTRSEAEERFLALIRKADLPNPAVNSRTPGFEVDFHWRRHRLVVEIDGLEFHSSRRAQQNDRRRDAALVAAGTRVLRLTWADITCHPEATIAQVALSLARGER